MNDEKYDHDRRPLISVNVGNGSSIELVPWWPINIVEPYLNQPTNSATLIVANLRGCCDDTVEYLQERTSRSTSARICPNATCGQKISGHIPEAEMRTAFRAHRAMFAGEWGPRALIESDVVQGGWAGIGRGLPGSGP